MVKPIDLSLNHKIADISLADFGRKEMQLSEREMPGLMECILSTCDQTTFSSTASGAWAKPWPTGLPCLTNGLCRGQP